MGHEYERHKMEEKARPRSGLFVRPKPVNEWRWWFVNFNAARIIIEIISVINCSSYV